MFVFGALRLTIASDQLLYIRTEQVYGLMSLLLWYVALAISPLTYVFGKQRLARLTFARRAIGVSAAYFALLHLGVALWGQLGGLSEIGYLPPLFKWSLGAGVAAVAILLIMALTSFDSVIRFMTFIRWKWLHRLGYIGGVLAILHIWMIGTHLEYEWVRWTAFIALGVLAGLEMFRTTTLLAKQFAELRRPEYFYTAFLGLWMICLMLLLSVPLLVQNYHGANSATVGALAVRHA